MRFRFALTKGKGTLDFNEAENLGRGERVGIVRSVGKSV